jgi:hypothetical protein
MAAQTEAACLLQSGALYTRRAGFEGPEAATSPVFLGVKHGAFSIYFGDAPIYHFDLEGRWQRAFVDGTHYLKGLDNSVRSIDREREGANMVLKRRTLSYAETADLDASIRQVAIDLMESTAAGGFPRVEPPEKKGVRPLSTDEVHDLLDRVASWDANRWFSHRERYLDAYRPLPFFPPECINPIPLQATTGQERGRAFGGSFSDEPAHVRTADEFEKHIKQVAKLLGRRSSQGRQIFLAGSDALRQSPTLILDELRAIGDVFPIRDAPPRGKVADGDLDETALQLDAIIAFLADFECPRPSPEDWQAFRAGNLKSVTLGIESGDDELRRSLGRQWSDDDLRSVVADLRAAEIRVNLALIANLGSETQRRSTADLILTLELPAGCIVSLLDRAELVDAPAGSPMVDREAAQKEMQTWLAPLKSRGVKVVPYSLDKQWI